MNAKQQQFEDCASAMASIADDPDCDRSYTRSKCKECAQVMREAAIGHARYETLRALNPREIVDIWKRSIAGERFDDMVDELVSRRSTAELEAPPMRFALDDWDGRYEFIKHFRCNP